MVSATDLLVENQPFIEADHEYSLSEQQTAVFALKLQSHYHYISTYQIGQGNGGILTCYFTNDDKTVFQVRLRETVWEATIEVDGNGAVSQTSNISEMQQQNTDKAVIEAMRQFKNKMKNAYILIYERVEVFDMSKVNDVIDDLKSV